MSENNPDDVWTSRWNDRYSNEEFAYGEEPNNYLREKLAELPVGEILFPAEGEGRNAVFAAKHGWAVSAFDISLEWKNKALKLADKNNVDLLGQIPLVQSIRESGDAGKPAALGNDSSAIAFKNLASEVARQVAIRNASTEMTKKVEIQR